jgi:hypothetical protein
MEIHKLQAKTDHCPHGPSLAVGVARIATGVAISLLNFLAVVLGILRSG